MSEETPANADVEPSTVSTTFDQTAIESSSITSPIVTVAPHDIFGKSIILLGSKATC